MRVALTLFEQRIDKEEKQSIFNKVLERDLQKRIRSKTNFVLKSEEVFNFVNPVVLLSVKSIKMIKKGLFYRRPF